MEEENKKACVFCHRDDNQVPLVQLRYQGRVYWICSQHIPVLIHDPAQLAGSLPGAENMAAG